MEDILMTVKEAERLRLLKNHASGMISLRQVSEVLGISYRQVKRVWKQYRLCGDTAVISKKRNKTNRALDRKIKENILFLVKEHYYDYGPTLITEKLLENHEMVISRETIRKMLIENKIRSVKKQRKTKIHPRRKRRSCFGELIQIDGSPHVWLEDRGPMCTLLLSVDDATSNLMAARFEPTEATDGYFRMMNSYLTAHGRPICLYSDKYGVFRVNNGVDRSKLTQFSRAMKELDIKMISAHSPQAKGRIERANGILQDRLVKKLRSKGISTIDEANAYLPIYLEKYNRRFGKAPAHPFNAHRSLDHIRNLEHILCAKISRKVSKNLEIQYENIIYQIQAPNRVNRLRGACVQMIKKMNGEILIEFKGGFLEFILHKECNSQSKIFDHKELVSKLENLSKKTYRPGKHHPWRSGKSMNF